MAIHMNISLKGEKITKRNVPIDLFANLLLGELNLHKTLGKIYYKGRSNDKFKELTELRVRDIRHGSLECTIDYPYDSQKMLSEYTNESIGNDDELNKKVVNERNNLISLVQGPDEEQAYKMLKDRFEEENLLVKVLNSLKRVWPQDYEIQYGVYEDKEILFKNSISEQYYDRIANWVKKTIEELSQNVFGVITRIRTDKNKSFFIKDSANSGIDCIMEPELLDYVIENLNRPVLLKGVITHLRSKRSCKEVIELTSFEEITFSKDNYYFLNSDLEFDVNYDLNEEFFDIYNEDLDLHIYGYSYDDLKDEFESNIEFLVLNIMQEEDEKLSESSIKTKMKLVELINLDKFKDFFI